MELIELLTEQEIEDLKKIIKELEDGN